VTLLAGRKPPELQHVFHLNIVQFVRDALKKAGIPTQIVDRPELAPSGPASSTIRKSASDRYKGSYTIGYQVLYDHIPQHLCTSVSTLLDLFLFSQFSR
jgi:hypothetical protein